MHQVQGVGDVAEVLQGCGDQQTVDAPAAVGAACHDDERTGDDGPECQVAGECSFNGQDCTAGNQANNADPAHDDSRLFGCFPFEGEHCQQGADGEFPEASAGVEVGEALVGVGFYDGEGQGGYEHRVEDEYRGGEEVTAESVYEVGYCCEEQGPDDEDLSLDGERPEVLEGRLHGGVLGVVVYGAEREVPVLEVEQGALCVGYDLRPAAGRKHEEGRNGATRDNHGGYG